MPAYALFDNVQVTDPDALNQYKATVLPVVERYAGRYVVMGGQWETLEGDWAPTYPVMIEFPDMAAARAWYHSETTVPSATCAIGRQPLTRYSLGHRSTPRSPNDQAHAPTAATAPGKSTAETIDEGRCPVRARPRTRVNPAPRMSFKCR